MVILKLTATETRNGTEDFIKMEDSSIDWPSCIQMENSSCL